MKHLKTYEVIVGRLQTEFKKYVVIETKKSIDLYEINNKEYKCSLLIYYSKVSKRMRDNVYNKIFFKITNIFNYEDNVILQSDDKEELLDYMKMIDNTNKFNI